MAAEILKIDINELDNRSLLAENPVILNDISLLHAFDAIDPNEHLIEAIVGSNSHDS